MGIEVILHSYQSAIIKNMKKIIIGALGVGLLAPLLFSAGMAEAG